VKDWWRRWSYEIPLAIGDALWEVLVVQFAAFLDRLTWRKVVACIPIVILAVAYHHSIPIPPELMLVGDLLAYIDIFSVVFLLGVLARFTTIMFIMKQAASRAAELAARTLGRLQRIDLRHRREPGSAARPRRRPDRSEDDRGLGVRGLGAAWGQCAIA
jgi:hypothetical protein